MIYFFADNHYGAFPGTKLYESLPEARRREIVFHCDDWELLESGTWEKDCELLILNMIGETCNQPHPGAGAEKAVRAYCERGGDMLLLHGSSAAFWQWPWWRTVAGLRWVRPGDPDNVVPSTHPHAPYNVLPAKTRHALAAKLRPFTMPDDEIYTELEQTNPVTVLMTTTIATGTFPQAYESFTPWGGRVIGFLPGHEAAAFEVADFLYDFQLLLESFFDRKEPRTISGGFTGISGI